MKDICFFTWFTKEYESAGEVFVRSFKKFHPDIDLFAFGEGAINEIFKTDSRLSFKNNKATMAKRFYNQYKRVVCIDADHFVFDRLTEIIEGDYELGAAANFNKALNVNISVSSGRVEGDNPKKEFITAKEYVSGGVIASSNKFFWDSYEKASLEKAQNLTVYDNDLLNIIWHTSAHKKKIFDGDYFYGSPKHKVYYGCSILPDEIDEQKLSINDNKIFCNGKQIKLYHLATGRTPHKQHISEIFPKKAHELINNILL